MKNINIIKKMSACVASVLQKSYNIGHFKLQYYVNLFLKFKQIDQV